jgi:hypothetical protein
MKKLHSIILFCHGNAEKTKQIYHYSTPVFNKRKNTAFDK